MSELKCPNCGQIFTVDESDYANIVQQVRNDEFQKELARREAELEQRNKVAIDLATSQNAQIHQQELATKNIEIANQERKIAELQAVIDNFSTNQKLAINEAVQQQAKIISEEHQIEIEKKNAEIASQMQELVQLRAKLESSETDKQLAVNEVRQESAKDVTEKQNEIISLRSEISLHEKESELQLRSVKEQYESQLKMKDEQIAYYKDFKAKQSTKMIGESLEQFCMNAFNQIRMTAFPNAYFEKDNDARTGSKGDFIFREEQDGIEFLSIMFEMKNEGDETATKHKNEDFFKELDKDRKEKNCEYAVLVSMLEADNDYYNNGIVDVSYRYPKMYVVRPQFFLTIITLLRNAALNSLKYQQELQMVRNQQIDLTNFESNMQSFKDAFGRNYELASRRFQEAIAEIDKSIIQMQKIRDALTSSERNLRLANDKAQDLSIKKLTKNAPSIREKFKEIQGTEIITES